MKPFPFNEAMQFGFGILRLSSKEFWAMTPLELAAAHRAFAPDKAAPIDKKTFDNLMSKFPDEEKKK